jgi:hypothetical protein
LQGSTLPLLAKRLRIDTRAEDAAVEEGLTTARTLADTAVAGRADTNSGAYFDTQRATLADAVRMREIDPASAHDVMRELDARQAGVTPQSE